MFENTLNELFAIVEKETEIYGSILKLSKEKTDIIVAGKVSELENMVKVEQALMFEIMKLEDQRESVLEKVAAHINVKKDDFNLSILMQHLEPSLKEKVSVYQKKMVGVMDDLKNTNELNSKLIKQALEYVDFSLNVMTSAAVQNNSYGGSGNVQEPKAARSLFDIKL